MKYCCESNECSHWFIAIIGGKSIGHCVDWWATQLQIESNQIQIGQQKAIESFRNEMVKPNPALLAIFQFIAKRMEKQKIIDKHESRKQLDKEG
jgi:hypothetical protein